MGNPLIKRVRRLEVIQGGKGRVIVVSVDDGREESVNGFLSAQGVATTENDLVIEVRRFATGSSEPSLVRVA